MKKQNNTFQQAIVGFFMVTLLGLLAYFTIVISGGDLLFGRNRRPVSIVFDQVGGLKDHDNVMYRGTKVGTVEKVTVTPSNLVVKVMIEQDVTMRAGYRVAVGNISMLGGNYLMLEEGEGEVLDLSAVTLHGETPTDWMEDMAKIASNLKRITSSPEVKVILTNLAAMSARARAICERAEGIVARVERGEGTVGKFLSTNDTVYADFAAAMTDAKVAVANVKAISEKLNRDQTIEAIHATVADAKATFANAKAISEKLNRDQTFVDLENGIAAFRKAAEGLDTKETVAKANALLDNLTAVAADLREGKGTIGKLVNDPKLYDEVNGLVRDVRQVIDNYRDTTPVSTFSSLAVGAF